MRIMTNRLITIITLWLAAATAMAAGNVEAELQRLEQMQQDDAVAALGAKLDSAQDAGKKQYVAYCKEVEDLTASPESPQHSEQMLMALLHHQLNSPLLDEEDKTRPRFLLQDASKNQIGSTATDVDLMMKDGSATTLAHLAATAPITLVYFSNPDCDACQRVKQRMEQSATVAEFTGSKLLNVVAIYTLDDKRLWQSSTMPPFVTDTWNYTQKIFDEETYVLPSTPLFYIVDSNMTVLMKNEASLNRVETALRRLMLSSDNRPQQLSRLLFRH